MRTYKRRTTDRRAMTPPEKRTHVLRLQREAYARRMALKVRRVDAALLRLLRRWEKEDAWGKNR